MCASNRGLQLKLSYAPVPVVASTLSIAMGGDTER